MANMLLTIQHDGVVFSPPVEDGVKIEWERTGSPGKLTFTTIGIEQSGMLFTEGDVVCFYYDNKPIFMGYVFTKKRDKEHRIEVTCYDQLRYLKNKYSYVFEKKTATQIIKALCKDFNLNVGTMDNTKYVIPAIAEENKSALDIILSVLEETLLNNGKLFVLYDDFGKLRITDSANMVSDTLIMEDTAENFDFKSSIDDETYNQVILYYKQDGEIVQVYSATSPSTVQQWGVLRYFEEISTPSIGQNKANSLLKLYNKKTREFKITGAFGDINVRGGTLIPVRLNLGEMQVNNYMLVETVTHIFQDELHTMDLALTGHWGDKESKIVSKTIGTIPEKKDTPTSNSNGTTIVNNYYGSVSNISTPTVTTKYKLTLECVGAKAYSGTITVIRTVDGKSKRVVYSGCPNFTLTLDAYETVTFSIKGGNGGSFHTTKTGGVWSGNGGSLTCIMTGNANLQVRWVR